MSVPTVPMLARATHPGQPQPPHCYSQPMPSGSLRQNVGVVAHVFARIRGRQAALRRAHRARLRDREFGLARDGRVLDEADVPQALEVDVLRALPSREGHVGAARTAGVLEVRGERVGRDGRVLRGQHPLHGQCPSPRSRTGSEGSKGQHPARSGARTAAGRPSRRGGDPPQAAPSGAPNSRAAHAGAAHRLTIAIWGAS